VLSTAVFCLLGAPANAADRIGVSARTGVDGAGCGDVASPCRTFQFAHNAIAAGGQIDILDPGDYGPVDITKSISIVNDGVGVAGVLSVPSGANAVVFDGAATDRVYLRGLTIDAPLGGLNGVLINTAGTAVLTGIDVRHYLHGINICPLIGPAKFVLSNSRVSDNTNGVAVMAAESPGSVIGEIINVVSVNNKDYGIHINGDNGAAPMRLSIVKSVFSNNGLGGVFAISSTTATSVSLRDVVAANNVNSDALNPAAGFEARGASVVMRLAHSVATVNNRGVASTAGAAVESFGDNDLQGNLAGAVYATGGSFAGVYRQ